MKPLEMFQRKKREFPAHGVKIKTNKRSFYREMNRPTQEKVLNSFAVCLCQFKHFHVKDNISIKPIPN